MRTRQARGYVEQLTVDGRPAAPASHREVEAGRFHRKVVVDPRPGGCHYWIGAIGGDGYGRFQAGTGRLARTVHAHRWAYEHAVGLRPTLLRLLHACDEPSCVNPAHLTPGSQAENMAQMHARGRGRRRHTASTDLRGPVGRARALRAALRSGWSPEALAVALAAGDPFAAQLTLPVSVPCCPAPDPVLTVTETGCADRGVPSLDPPPVPGVRWGRPRAACGCGPRRP